LWLLVRALFFITVVVAVGGDGGRSADNDSSAFTSGTNSTAVGSEWLTPRKRLSSPEERGGAARFWVGGGSSVLLGSSFMRFAGWDASGISTEEGSSTGCLVPHSRQLGGRGAGGGFSKTTTTVVGSRHEKDMEAGNIEQNVLEE